MEILLFCKLVCVHPRQMYIHFWKSFWTERTSYHTRIDLITPWNRVLLENLTVPQLVKKFRAFYRNWKFIAPFKTASSRLPILSQISPVHTPRSHFLKVHFKIILPSTPMFSKWSLSLNLNPSGFTTIAFYAPLLFPIHATCPTHLSFLDLITRIIVWIRKTN